MHGLKARPELNGRRGRVLPSSGRGSAPDKPSPGRVAVRLAPKDPSDSTSKLEVISVKPANLRSPHTGAAGGASGGSSQQQWQQQQQSARSSTAAAEAAAAAFSKRQRVKQLLKQEFELWECGSTLTPDTLRRANMPERLICCGQCGKAGVKPAAAGGGGGGAARRQPAPAGQSSSGDAGSGGSKPSSKAQLRQQQRQQQHQEEEDDDGDRISEFIALKRTHAPSPIPLPASAELVQLRCLDCFAAMAVAVGMKLSAQGAEDFCDTFMMGPLQVCSILQGLPTASWSGVKLGKGEMY